jgi:hypothetical protein
MRFKKEIKYSLYYLSILFFALSFFSAGIFSSTENTILETKNQNTPLRLFDITFNPYKIQIGDIQQLGRHGTFEIFRAEILELHHTFILYNHKVKNIFKS